MTTETTSHKAGIYVRISQDREGERWGVQAQEEDCRKLAERLGLAGHRASTRTTTSRLSTDASRERNGCACGTTSPAGGQMRSSPRTPIGYTAMCGSWRISSTS